jgi:hypothetical protein
MMIQAKQLSEILKVAQHKPLTGEDFDDFFVNTDKARGYQPALLLADFLQSFSEAPQKILFTGHRGSGKSTELWRLQQEVKDMYFPIAFSVQRHLGLVNLEFIDLVFLVMERIYTSAREKNIHIDEDLLHNILKWVEDTTEIKTKDKKAGVEVEVGATTPKFLSALFAHVKGILHMSSDTRVEIRRKIKPRIAQLVERCNLLLQAVNKELEKTGKRTLVIVEDLDKISTPTARGIFCDNAEVLVQLDTHIIYTIPISIFYSRDITGMRRSFDRQEVLPMIKIKEKNTGNFYPPGKQTMEEIIFKRIDKTILAKDAIRYLLDKTGGCLNDLFDILLNGALEGIRSKKIFDKELAQTGAKRIKRFYEMALSTSPEGDIQPEQYFKKLKEVYDSKTKKISADPVTMDLLNSLALLEYNEERWLNVHPLVVDIMQEMKII